MDLRFVQVSDIHFGQERDGSLPEHDDARRRLVADAEKFAAERGPANQVLVIGDIAFSGKRHEYDRAGTWLDALTKAVGCPERAVRMVPGNHDCDRDKVDHLCRIVHDSLRGETPKSVYGHLEKFAKSPDDQNPLIGKLRAYRDFASGYESDFESIGAPLWIKDFPLECGFTLRLVGMNSVQVCDDSDKSGNMILGNTQYVLDHDTHIIPVVLVHHPLSWFKDKDEAETYLHNRAHVIMVGHEHIPKINKISSPHHERVELYSGATNAPDSGTRYRHTYNWIEITVTANAGACRLRLDIFARTWDPESADFAPDNMRMHGNNSVTFEINCPKARPRASVVRGAATEAVRDPGSTVGESAAVENHAAESDGAAMAISEEDVAQLRFLFWRHLNWQQRLKVLVDADVLPPSADKPVSQTLERVALDTARANGKLAAVWDAMTPLLPEDKRKKNPFK